MLSLLALLLAAAPDAAPEAATEPRMLDNGWFAGEIGNGCMAMRELANGERLTMRLVKWDDLSDSLIFWRPGLPPLMTDQGLSTGRTPEQEEADAAENFHLSAFIDGREVAGGFGHFQLVGFDGKPGAAYRIGIDQAAFIAALAGGTTLELRRHDTLLAAFPVAGSEEMAKELAACVAKPPKM